MCSFRAFYEGCLLRQPELTKTVTSLVSFGSRNRVAQTSGESCQDCGRTRRYGQASFVQHSRLVIDSTARTLQILTVWS
ncbi:hypothetical protein PHMEG_00014206 [Phytophthora megakarya]|uniref:Uncharacterized protein n=1 Tax=Phytophthora megakarya TaxID=4795 RepID=A0A225W5F7_9STRA|nr:hypothetical protein PHMEG_00014206 [Phytophthora megakarya]